MSHYSVLILTLNEERNLPRCLASVAACDDVVVLDSGSQDRTTMLAQAAGARVFTRTFDTFAGQRNYADWHIEFRHPWVFHLDADEQFTDSLAKECDTVATRDDIDGFFAAPKMLWHGRWIPHCTDYPAWQARFVRAGSFRFIDVGHGQREAPDMRMAHLQHNYLHDLSSGGESEWLDKHRRYARAEACRVLADNTVPRFRDLLARDGLVRRRALKRVSYRLPFRPASRFIYQYLLRAGFLDGSAGLQYCRLLARYEGFAAAELRRLKSGSA